MELKWLKIKGYKRFHKPSTLNLAGRLVALIGPNEAGKTSILEAISHLGNDQQIPSIESTRATAPDTEISGGFFLDKEDLDNAKLAKPSRLIVKKTHKGSRQFEIDPLPSLRDKKCRNAAITQIRRLTANKKLINDLKKTQPSLPDQLDQLTTQIENGPEDLPPKLMQQMDQYSVLLKEHLSEKGPKYAVSLHSKLTELAEIERTINPTVFAINELKKRIPQFLVFTDEERGLVAEYNLAEIVTNPPASLRNLTSIAKLNLQKLLTATQKGDWAEKKNLLDPANDILLGAFKETWSQSGVHVHFEVEGTILRILIVDEGKVYSTLGERSDGLRQFVALQAFTTMVRANKPILLIDEAELHLHYDGQADLIQMLTRQNVTQKVIYSTHSAGCLPEDLGVGTRLIVQNSDTRTSKIQNKFWQSKEQGFTPLLFGMGATTLAFFPVRYALVAEGVTEMLLLPTLFKQATNRDYLGFQVVPGLSETSLTALPAMETSGERVAYFVDADDGGEELRLQLITLGVDSARIQSVKPPSGTSYTTEDLINAHYFTDAVNKVFGEFYPEVPHIKPNDVSSPGRIQKLNEYCVENNIKPIAKTEIAYHLLDFVAYDSNIQIIAPEFKHELASIHKEICKVLSIIPEG